MVLTSYLQVYVGVHCKENNGILSEIAPFSIVTLRIKVDMVNPFSATVRYIGFCSSGEKCREPIYWLKRILLQNIIQIFCVVIITFILHVICENFITNN
jgi:hypothetical protein